MSNASSQLLSFSATDEHGIIDSPNATGSPERRLILAVLERAILDYVGNDRREIDEAEAWLFGELENDLFAPFSFPWVCQQLDLDMKEIAKTIAAMPKRGSRKVAPWYFAKPKQPSKNAVCRAKVTKGNFPHYH